jgi:hypothetical protein
MGVLSWGMNINFSGSPVAAPTVFVPTMFFEAASEPAALVSTLNLLTWQAAAELVSLTSEARALLFEAAAEPAALVSTLNLLTFEAASDPAALVSVPRGSA